MRSLVLRKRHGEFHLGNQLNLEFKIMERECTEDGSCMTK